MTNIKINYHQYEDGDYKTSALCLEGVGFEPESLYKNTSKSFVYHKCPAWQHKAQRTFIIRSPVNITLELDLEQEPPSIWCPNLNQNAFNKWVGGTFDNKPWHTKENTTIQLSIPRFLFWTKNKNVWFEQRPHPYTASKNNLVSIGAWFNISSWIRNSSFAFDVVDLNKPIIIKRGDPIFEICFYTNNFDDKIELIKTDPPQKILDQCDKNLRVKTYAPHLADKFLFQKQESKCPFAFLWKKTPQDKG